MSNRSRKRKPAPSRIPSERSRAFAMVAERSVDDSVVVACMSRRIRRQYQRSVAKRGGDLEHVHFFVCPTMPPDAAQQLARTRVGRETEIIDVRSLRTG